MFWNVRPQSTRTLPPSRGGKNLISTVGLGRSGALALAAMLSLSGCGPDPVRVYRAPKEISSTLSWDLPTGWKEQPPGEMRVASFVIQGEGEKKAEVGIIPLPLIKGRDTEFVNLWRDQLRLKQITPEDLPKITETVSIGSEQGQLFDLAAEDKGPEDKFVSRIMAATLNRGTSTWFIKMSGESNLVGENKSAFVRFLKSLNLPLTPPQTGMARGGHGGQAHPGMGAGQSGMEADPHAGHDHSGEGEAEAGGLPAWKVPDTWKSKAPGQMLLAKFGVGADGAGGEVTVSAFPGDVGGTLPNINRWRRQIGLAEASEADLPKLMTELELDSGKASLVDMSGGDNRLLVVLQKNGGQTWFYKLLGPEKSVAVEKEAFLGFVRSVRYAGN